MSIIHLFGGQMHRSTELWIVWKSCHVDPGQAVTRQHMIPTTDLVQYAYHFRSFPKRRPQHPCRLHSTVVVPVDNIRILGIQLDSSLDMRKHISQVTSACFFHLPRQMRKILGRKHRQRLITAVILRIEYCNVICVGVYLLPLQCVMNVAALFATDLGPRDHISQTMRELHWLPIWQRIDSNSER